ncbi:MAG TPA: hypothetical protein VKK79_20420, partial [Candidatus Lokiarchaeia archaeon]|nr:hypothetical protein [Candidatus Lokiarchaeia archaeon]
MQRKIYVIILMGLFPAMLLLAAPARQARGVPRPASDPFASAQYIPGNTGNYVGQINPAGSANYYVIWMNSLSRLDVNLTQLSANLDLELYNSSEMLVAGSYNTGTASQHVTVYYGPNTGDYMYYIKVFGATGTEVSSYALNITVTSWGDFEPNNNFADATSLEVYGTSTFA